MEQLETSPWQLLLGLRRSQKSQRQGALSAESTQGGPAGYRKTKLAMKFEVGSSGFKFPEFGQEVTALPPAQHPRLPPFLREAATVAGA